MQPTSPSNARAASGADPSGTTPGAAATAAVELVVERPTSDLARGSFAWPAWVVIAVAMTSAVGALWWWLRLQTGLVTRRSASGATTTPARGARQ